MNLKSLTLVTILFFAAAIPALAQDKVLREDIEWIDAYMPNTNNNALPRVLLIGNSIVRGYYPEVVKLMEGKAYVARLSTSKSICDPGLNKEIALIMGYYKFDIVQFNNGLHGFDYTEENYKKAFPAFVKAIRKAAPKAKLIWATTTPIYTYGNVKSFDPRTERVKARNQIAFDYISSQKDIRINDLWTIAINHPEYYQNSDGTHPVAAGFTALARQVSSELIALLTTAK